MKRWIALALCALASPSYAHLLWWERVTHYEDGAEINEPVSYRIEWTDGSDTFERIDGTRTLTAAAATMPDPVGLLRCYRVVSFFAHASEVDPGEPSNVWCKDMRPNTPLPVRRKLQAVTGLSGN